MGCDINEVQNRVANNDSHCRYECIKAEKKIWRENQNHVDKTKLRIMKNKKKEDERSARSDEEEVVNGPSKTNVKPKGRKWKSQARNTKAEGVKDNGLIGAKRSSSDGNWLSSKCKKNRVFTHESNHIRETTEAQ